MLVDVNIKNLPADYPKGFTNDAIYVVARRDDYTSALWYYGTYNDPKQAWDIAIELENGIVVKRQ